MENNVKRFILASASPRRKELLEVLGIDFDILASEADEDSIACDVPPKLYVQELALLKAAAAAKTVLKSRQSFIISADTIVTLDDEILGKPSDGDNAKDMLRALSGREHEVYTGYCIMRLADGKTVCNSVCTQVKFKELTDDTINTYIATGEPMDKAGAYGIQGKGSVLVDSISGDYFNVVGLPISALSDTFINEFDIDILKGE